MIWVAIRGLTGVRMLWAVWANAKAEQDLAARVTCLEKDKAHRMTMSRKAPDGTWEPT